jgi:hypothetical protein
MADKVRVLAHWDGYCGACAHEARPLVLTLGGASGFAAWWRGVEWEDRALRLTCRVCGDVQDVPWDEADEVEPVGWRDFDAPRVPGTVDLVRHAPVRTVDLREPTAA